MLSIKKCKSYLNSGLFKSAGTYGFFSLLNKMIPFFLLPVMTRYLTPEDYGYTAMFAIMVSLTMPFLGFNMHGAYSRAFFSEDRFDSKVYIGNTVLFVLAQGLLFVTLFFIFRRYIGKLFVFPSQWVVAVAVVATAKVLNQLVLTNWQVRKLSKSYGIFQNLMTFMVYLLSLLFVVAMGMNWIGRVIANIFTATTFAVLGLWLLKRNNWIKFSLNKSYLWHGLAFGAFLIPHRLSGFLNTSIDRIFISNMVNTSATGIYTVGYQVGAIIGLLATSFNLAYTPWLYAKLKEATFKEKIRIVKFTYLYFIIITVIAVALGFFVPPFFKYFLGKQFAGSGIFVSWIALGYAFQGMYFMVVNYIFYVEKTHILAMVTFLTAGINCLLNYIFIARYGAIGAAQATSLTYLLMFLLVWYLSAKVYSMPWTLVSNKKKINRKDENT